MDHPGEWNILDTVSRNGKCAIFNVTIKGEKFVLKQYYKRPLKRELLKRQSRLGKPVTEFSIIKEEFDLMKEVKHERIIGVESIIEHGPSIYLVLEYGGEPLAPDSLEDRKRYAIEDVRKYLVQISEGLEFLHSKGIIHGDIKPSNILYTKEGNIKICDLGSAVHDDIKSDAITKIPKGTPAYNSPELCEASSNALAGGDVLHGKPIDMWALGITVYRLLFGVMPFYCDGTIFQLYDSILNDDILIPTEVLTNNGGMVTVLPNDFAVILDGLLERDPEKRMTIQELRKILQQ